VERTPKFVECMPSGRAMQDVLAAAEARVDELRERLEDERQEVAASSATLAAATEQAQVRLVLAGPNLYDQSRPVSLQVAASCTRRCLDGLCAM
jgi:hypothetical protein